MQQYYSLGDVAKLLNTQPYTIHYLVTTGQVPEPKLRAGNRRLWQIEEITPVSELLRVRNGREQISRRDRDGV